MADIEFLMEVELVKAYALISLIYFERIQDKNRKYAVRNLLKQRRRKGHYHALVPKLRISDTETFKNFHRMDPSTFDILLHILGPVINHSPTRKNEKISVGERLSLTLRYLASGDSMISLGVYAYRIGGSTTSAIIREICELIWEKLRLQDVFPTPSTQMWENISKEFLDMWQFPNCLGAIDGKHVTIQAFPNHNFLTCNYKHSHSVVLMAVADASYKFVFVDIGALGHNNDCGIFKKSTFGNAIINNPEILRIPPSKRLPGTNCFAPYVFLGDEAFPLKSNLLRPYPGRNCSNLRREQDVFNKRLSRARRVVENAFGILASRFRIYRKPIIASKETVINIVKATTALHNWLINLRSPEYFASDLVDQENRDGSIRPGTWQSIETRGLLPIGRTGSNHPSTEAEQIRTLYANYFMSQEL